MKKSIRLAAAVAAAALALAPAVAGADHGPDSASGRGRTQFGFTDVRFSAKSSAFGTDSTGTVRFTNANIDPNQVYEGEVTCLKVTGATATTPASALIGGRLTKAPAGNVAQGFLISATDSGKFGNAPDAMTVALQTLAPPQDACPASFFSPQPLVEGEITIHNTLP